MNLARIQPIADAILYEGYMLYPYRSSALKNRERWIFGVLLPKRYSEAVGGLEPWSLQSECLVIGGPASAIELRLRFLQPVAGRTQELAGQEALPRHVDLGPIELGKLDRGAVHHGFSFVPLRTAEPVCSETEPQEPIAGAIEIAAMPVADAVYKLTVRVLNLSPLELSGAASREHALRRALASTHVVLGVRHGEFASMTDPPDALRAFAEGCHNVGAWPILVGEPGARDAMLCSPIILADYPEVAPESSGDLFDATEIEEILTLRILTLSEEERRELAAGDPRTAALLHRTDALAERERAALHGALRSQLRPRTLRVAGIDLAAGDRVRLRPRGRSDVFDLALAGQLATIVSVEQDFDGECYFTVTVDADPGRDLGAQGKPGHRFFFRPDEVELPGTGAS